MKAKIKKKKFWQISLIICLSILIAWLFWPDVRNSYVTPEEMLAKAKPGEGVTLTALIGIECNKHSEGLTECLWASKNSDAKVIIRFPNSKAASPSFTYRTVWNVHVMSKQTNLVTTEIDDVVIPRS